MLFLNTEIFHIFALYTLAIIGAGTILKSSYYLLLRKSLGFLEHRLPFAYQWIIYYLSIRIQKE
jgi:hypothetical protein